MVAEVERSAAVGQPAHDRAVAADHLLAIDAEVLPPAARAAGDHQSPGDQRPGVTGPARLHRQRGEVDVVALDDDLLAGRGAHLFRRHGEHLPQHRQLVPRVAQAARRLGLLEIGKHLADASQFLHRLGAHAEGDPPRGAEEIGEDRHGVAAPALDRGLEEQRRSARAQHPVGEFGHLEAGRNRLVKTLQFAQLL
jgi:hypothetical protein